MIAPRAEIVDGLRARGVHERAHVRADAGPPGERAEDQRLEGGERGIVAFHEQHGVPRVHAVALVQGVHVERGEVVAAQLQQRNRFVDAAEPPAALRRHLPGDACLPPVGAQRGACPVEVHVAELAGADALYGEVEERGVDPPSSSRGHD